MADPHQARQHRKEGQGRLGGPGQQQRVADSQGAAAATADHQRTKHAPYIRAEPRQRPTQQDNPNHYTGQPELPATEEAEQDAGGPLRQEEGYTIETVYANLKKT